MSCLSVTMISRLIFLDTPPSEVIVLTQNIVSGIIPTVSVVGSFLNGEPYNAYMVLFLVVWMIHSTSGA